MKDDGEEDLQKRWKEKWLEQKRRRHLLYSILQK